MSRAPSHDTIDIVIVSYNSARVITALLESIPEALGGLAYRTVVVDNGSTDGTVQITTAREDCLTVVSTNQGYAAGINRGARHLQGYGPILALNPDVVLSEGAVPALVRTLAGRAVGVAVPRVLNEDGTLFPSLRREPTIGRALGLSRTGIPHLSEQIDDPASYEAPQAVDWALGAAMLISRECFDVLGGFDESFFLYSEETDFCLRARDHGLVTAYCPGAEVMHIGGESGRSARTHTMQLVNRVRLYRRRHGPLAASAYYAVEVAREAAAWLLGREQSKSAVTGLLLPSRRPPELGCADSLVPK